MGPRPLCGSIMDPQTCLRGHFVLPIPTRAATYGCPRPAHLLWEVEGVGKM